MRFKQLLRRTMAIGFSNERDSVGEIRGHELVHCPKRNAYELIGLRRPARNSVWRLKPC
jgi:hypothetical protein